MKFIATHNEHVYANLGRASLIRVVRDKDHPKMWAVLGQFGPRTHRLALFDTSEEARAHAARLAVAANGDAA